MTGVDVETNGWCWRRLAMMVIVIGTHNSPRRMAVSFQSSSSSILGLVSSEVCRVVVHTHRVATSSSLGYRLGLGGGSGVAGVRQQSRLGLELIASLPGNTNAGGRLPVLRWLGGNGCCWCCHKCER